MQYVNGTRVCDTIACLLLFDVLLLLPTNRFIQVFRAGALDMKPDAISNMWQNLNDS